MHTTMGIKPSFAKIISANAVHFIALRHTIHANPELGFEEQHTATLVARELQAMGLPVVSSVAGTGVVAVIDSGKPGKTVALRAELDALPLSEQTALSYQSRHPGKMHACGHDGHVATLLAAAQALTLCKDQFRGKVKLIFQPAEENCKLGAPAMIAAGILENPTVDAIFAYHNHPGIETGTVLTRTGSALSGNTHITIIVHGKSGHAATPEHNIDPILIGSAIAQTFPIINQQLSTADEPVVMRITEFNSGTSRNVVPATATLGGTIRTASLKQRDLAKLRIQTMAQYLAQAQGAAVEITFTDYIPPTINTASETALVTATAKRLLGTEKVRTKPQPARASEDFAFYLQKIPGSYFFMGNGINTPSCHNAEYDFNDGLLPLAAELLCQVAVDYLLG